MGAYRVGRVMGDIQSTHVCCSQWRRLHTARGHVLPPPPRLVLQMAGHGGTVSRRTANKKLTITKALTKTTNCTFRAETVKRLRTHFSHHMWPPLSNYLRRHWLSYSMWSVCLHQCVANRPSCWQRRHCCCRYRLIQRAVHHQRRSQSIGCWGCKCSVVT